jgi:hypothetical protein
MATQTFYVEPAFFENFDSKSAPFDYTLNQEEKLCFTCPLSECKENSNKCPINILRAELRNK